MSAASLHSPFALDLSAPSRDGAARFPLAWAVAGSILIHGIALGWLPDIRKMHTLLAEPLQVFMPPPVVEPLPAIAVPQAPTFKPSPNRSSSREAAQREPARPTSTPVLTRSTEVEATAAPVFSVPAPIQEVPPSVTESSRTAVPAPRATSLDPAALAAYGKHIAGAVAAQQKYPRLAMMRQWQGTTLLQLELAADGQLRDVRVLSSSGHDILDRQAIDMVRAALPLPPLPAGLADRSLTVDVPVVFRLAS